MRLIALALIGCSGSSADKPDTGTSTGTTDSGTTDSAPYTGGAGCITVDGAGDYPDIATALSYAQDGATVEVCAGTYATSVLVDKAVTLQGVDVVIEGPTNEPALTVTAAATVRGLTLHSTRSGVVVSGAGATLADLVIEAPANWGVEAQAATDLLLENLTVSDAAYGGVSVAGGDMTLRGSTFTNTQSYGVFATDATIDVSGNSFVTVVSVGEGDGVAIYGTDTAVLSSGNTIQGADAGIVVDQGGLSSSADRIEGVNFGLYANEGEITIADDTISDVYALGVWAVSSTDAVTVQNTSVLTDFETSYDNPYADLWDNNFVGGGLVLAGTSIALADLTISGFRSFGAFLGSPGEDAVPATAERVNIAGVGRYGLYISGADTTLSDSTLSFMVEPEYGAPCRDDVYATSWYPYVSAAIFNVSSALTVTGSSFVSNQGWGIANYEGTAAVTDTSFQNHDCSAIIDFQGGLGVTDSSFEGAGFPGAIWDYYGATTVSRGAFSGSTGTSLYGYDSSGTWYVTEYSGQGKAIYGQGSAAVDVTDSTFTDGDYGVYLVSASGSVTDSSFAGMNRTSVYAVASDLASDVAVEGVQLDDVGDYVFVLQGVVADLQDNVVSSQRQTVIEYNYYYDGKLYSSSTSTYDADVLLAQDAEVGVEGFTLGDVASDAFVFTNTSASLTDITATSTAGTVVAAYWDEDAPDLEVSGVDVATVGTYGLLLENEYSEGGYVGVDDFTIGTAGEDGAYLSGLGEVNLSAVSLAQAGGYGLHALSVTGLLLDGVTVTDAAYDGLYLDSSTAVLAAVSATGSGDNGLQLESSSVDVQGNVFTGNTTYGMRCEDTTLLACAANDLSGNGTGEHSGCDDACGE